MSASPQYIPSPTPDLAKIGRALISVSDKTGLVELGKALAAHGVEILSTGGSAKSLREAGVKVIEVSDHTGFPEIMDGRVKTLQPAIHGGILARRTDGGHAKAMSDHKIAAIDLVVVNLYPFEATVARGADFPTCVENIDIGGPALIRAAAKNHDFVTVVVDQKNHRLLEVVNGRTGALPPKEGKQWETGIKGEFLDRRHAGKLGGLLQVLHENVDLLLRDPVGTVGAIAVARTGAFRSGAAGAAAARAAGVGMLARPSLSCSVSLRVPDAAG